MKYMINWSERPQGSPAEYENAQKRVLLFVEAVSTSGAPRYGQTPAASTADYLVPSQPCSERSTVTPSGTVNLTSTLPRFAISSVPG